MIQAKGRPDRDIDRDKLDEVIETIIFSRLISTPQTRNMLRGPHAFNLSDMDDIDMSDLLLKDRGASDRLILLEDLEERWEVDPNAVWPVNIGWLHEDREDVEYVPEPGYEKVFEGVEFSRRSIRYLKSISVKDARKYRNLARISTKMVEYSTAIIMKDGCYSPIRVVLSWFGGRWVDAHGFDKTGRSIPAIPWINDMGRHHVPFGLSLALTRRYEWCVSIGMDGSPKLTFASDPSGLRAIFADRDKPPDRNRRTPLRHWVSDHWRQKRGSAEDEAFVRRHLRGTMPFKWYGYDCVIRPSPFDEESAKTAMRR